MSNAGSSTAPWSTLEAVFAANKTFAAGDVVLLRDGYHGAPTVKGHNSGAVTVQPQDGHTPRLRKLIVTQASQWILSGLDISPLHAGATSYDSGKHVDIQASASYITLQDSRIRSVFSVAGWSVSHWTSRVGGALVSSAPHTRIIGNRIENVSHGIYITNSAPYSVVSHNVIKNLRDDGFRGLASHCKFEYNTLMNMYGITDNHDDAFQSYTNGPRGVGTETIYNVEVRGNVFISFTDPNQPFKSKMQGIGCFDGMFENWIVENNVVVTDMWHGIAFYGATNCRVVNNTVVKNPVNAHGYTPWITVNPHKNGTPSKGNVVYNNLTSDMNITASVGSVSHNLESKSYASHFVNWAGFDLRLVATSSAIDAGTASYAPAVDADARARTAPYDLGAYEYGSASAPEISEPEMPDSVTSSGAWRQVPFDAQTGAFTVSYQASPLAAGVDAVTGLSSGPADGFGDLAAIVRFSLSGAVDARNGEAYEAVQTLLYQPGLIYRITIRVDLATRRYSATVTPLGGTAVTIAEDFSFRGGQAGATRLDHLGLYATGGGISVNDLTVSTEATPPPPEADEPAPEEPSATDPIVSAGTWEGVAFAPQSGAFSIAYKAVVSAARVDAVTGLSRGTGDWWDDLGAVLRFSPGGFIDARNGSVYQAASTLSYAPGVTYHVSMSVDVSRRRYSATVTPNGGAAVVIADNYAFRTELGGVTTLDTVSLHALGGAIAVSDVALSTGSTTPPPETEEPEVEEPEPSAPVISTEAWESIGIAPQSGTFTIAYDAVASTAKLDAVTGLSLGAADAYGDLAAIVRFSPAGVIDARNGGSYQAARSFVYVAGLEYRIAMTVDLATRRYSATVTPAGGTAVTIASNYAFRTDQSGATRLDTLSLYATGGAVSVRNVTTSAGTTPPPEPPAAVVSTNSWKRVPFAAQSDRFTLTYDATVSRAKLDAVTGLSLGAADGYGDLAAIVRFAPGGVVDARNGGSYQAAGSLTYAAGVTYRVVMTVDISTRRYTATVTPAGGTPITIANNYAFRTDQSGATKLDSLSLYATGGSLTISNVRLN